MLALTHVPSPGIERGERSFVERRPIHYPRALRQHAAYRRTLEEGGCEVRLLDGNADHPDAVFIEDTAVVLDEVAILASMGAESRRPELAAIEPELRRYREVRRIELPATLEGGDVLRVGRTLLVGETARTNRAGIEALAELTRPCGYTVRAAVPRGCLHFKSACTALPDGRLLANPAWIDPIPGFEMLPVPPEEPDAANLLLLEDTVILSAAFPRTADLIRSLGFPVRTVDLSEFALAEGAATCLSLLITR